MKIVKVGKYSKLVKVEKGEDFPGCKNIPGRAGYHLLWTGSNLSDFQSCEFLGRKLGAEEIAEVVQRM